MIPEVARVCHRHVYINNSPLPWKRTGSYSNVCVIGVFCAIVDQAKVWGIRLLQISRTYSDPGSSACKAPGQGSPRGGVSICLDRAHRNSKRPVANYVLTLAQGGQMTRVQNLSGAHLSLCNTAVAEAALATMAAAMAIAVAAVA